MTSAGSSQILYVKLPLVLEAAETKERINEADVISIANTLRDSTDLLRGHIERNHGLSFIKIKEILYDSTQRNICLYLECNSESQLKSVYKCLKTADNALSCCISQYFIEQSIGDISRLHTKIACKIYLPKKLYRQCKTDLCEEDESQDESTRSLNRPLALTQREAASDKQNETKYESGIAPPTTGCQFDSHSEPGAKNSTSSKTQDASGINKTSSPAAKGQPGSHAESDNNDSKTTETEDATEKNKKTLPETGCQSDSHLDSGAKDTKTQETKGASGINKNSSPDTRGLSESHAESGDNDSKTTETKDTSEKNKHSLPETGGQSESHSDSISTETKENSGNNRKSHKETEGLSDSHSDSGAKDSKTTETNDASGKHEKTPQETEGQSDSHSDFGAKDPISTVTPAPKKFLLYYPQIKGWKVKKLTLEISDFGISAEMQKHVDDINEEIQKHVDDIYEVAVQLPDENNGVKYHYACHSKGSFVGWKTKDTVSSDFSFRSQKVFRDIWQEANVNKQDILKLDEQSTTIHLLDVLFHCHETLSILETSMIIEDICSKHLPLENALNVLKVLEEAYRYRTSTTSSVYLLVTIGALISEPHICFSRNIISQSTSESIVKELEHNSASDLPEISLDKACTTCLAICQFIYKDCFSWLRYWNSCCLFYDDKFMLKIVQQNSNDLKTVQNTSVNRNVSLELCKKLYTKTLKNRSEDAHNTLLILFQNLPSEIVFFVYGKLKASNMDVSGDEMHLQDSLYSIIKASTETGIELAKEKRNFKTLQEFWDVCKSGLPEDSIREKFTDTLIAMIKMYPSSTPRGKEFPLKLVLKSFGEFSVYENANAKKSLLNTVMNSWNHEVNELFLLLADNSQMFSEYEVTSTTEFENFLKKYAVSNLKLFTGEEREITFILDRLRKCSDLAIARSITCYREGLINVMHSALDWYHFSAFLSLVDIFEDFGQTNPWMHEVFLNHLKSVLENRRERPAELLQSIPSNNGKMIVNSRLSAMTVCTLIDALEHSSHKDNIFDHFMDIVSQYAFWVTILSCSGKSSYLIQANSTYKEVKQCIMHIVTSLKTQEISYTFVQRLDSSVQGSHAAKTLLELFSKETSIDVFLSDAKMKFKEVKSALACTREVLSKVKMCSAILQNEFLILIERVQTIEDNLVSGIINPKDCNDKYIWNKIKDLPILCKKLLEVVRSNVFWNVSRENVQTEFKEKRIEATAEDDDPISSLRYLYGGIYDENDCISYLGILQNYGITLYVHAWMTLKNDETCRMETILRMFGAEPDLQTELSIASSVIHCSLSKGITETLERIFLIDVIKKRVEAMESVLTVFSVDWLKESEFANSIKSFKELLNGRANDFLFRDVQLALETLFSLDKMLSEDTMSIMIALERASTLVTFLKTIVEEDIRNLIEAVNDLYGNQVSESTVSSLIEVKQFLYPLLKFQHKQPCKSFLQTLEGQTLSFRASSRSLPLKIEDCLQNLHNLKSLYNGVANRGEQTKEIIQYITKKGTFHFRLDASMSAVLFEASYKQHEIKEIKNQSTLTDLRSRALLLKNSERIDMNESRFNREEFTRFIDNVELCTDIADILFALHSSGNIEYMKVEEQVQPEELLENKTELCKVLQTWMVELSNVRKAHYLMNFVQGSHIHVLYRYLEVKDENETIIQTILNYIHPELDARCLKEMYSSKRQSSDVFSNKLFLDCIGHSLHTAYSGLHTVNRPVFTDSSSLTSIVRSNKLMVVQLEVNSPHIVRTVLTLYLNTTKLLPEPFQIVFCSRETTWMELELFLQRCLGSKRFFDKNTLFCISNVELLSSDIQYKLVEALCQLDKKTDFLLAVLCRGSRSHSFISEFNEMVTSVEPASDKTVIDIFHKNCPNVFSVTSDRSGLGKTSKIKVHAHKNRKAVATLHVSGPLRKTSLIDRFLKLEVEDYMALHVDIGSVDDMSGLDIFLFELIFLKYVSAGRVAAGLKTSYVYIEIANTINDNLRNSLQTAVLFKRWNVKWNGINDLVVSKELYSSVQVVCHYLNALQEGNLDKVDIIFKSNINHPLSSKKCRNLLQNYIQDIKNCSYPTLFTFLGVLADQLKKMSGSSFFRVKSLIDMVGNKALLTVKSKLVEALIVVAKDFATRSVEFCRESQTSTIKVWKEQQCDLAQKLTTDSMIRWEDSNHLIFVFHNQNINTISALYRHLAKVPADVRTLFEGQMKRKMQDFSEMTQDQLRSMLQKVARVNPLPIPSTELLELSKEYALTTDNLLKMVLIMMRIKANIPVIVMGETGCGKTSLIRYLAGICQVEFEVINIHAGVPEEEIIKRVMHNNSLSENNVHAERWLFLDEINTSENIWLISDIICHHSCLGHELAPNLVILGACNPYKLRTIQAISTAGLEGKVKTDELSRLVYRVLPLPEMMVDYVWDFGVLNEKDEKSYIQRMVDGVFGKNELHLLFTSLISASQAFVRNHQGSTYSVSLRDVQRCKLLANWFFAVLQKKKMLKNSKLSCQDINIKSMILSLTHCYQSRFAEKSLRSEYQDVIGYVFALEGYNFAEGQNVFIQNVIKEEQADILNRMRLPQGTAKNTALQENVFVILVCIFNKIPVFVVGKPGCSKSLAMQLIKSNLRGKDSEDEFFRTLPQLYCVSFQGSESCTSDGIIKVFEHAKRYQDSNNTEEVFSVVILDEIGLAEVSRFNPLKVLHSLLEPEGRSQPDVAVVGISNWALDASKMNRAIYLSRPDMDEEELLDTAFSISESFLENKQKSSFNEIKGMASAYFHYIEENRFKNFHGLRDYYALIKYAAQKFAALCSSCSSSKEVKAEIIVDGIARNFGGLPEETQTLYDVFQKYIQSFKVKECSVMQLVKENIADPFARHLMLITTGESVLETLDQALKQVGCGRKEIIFGSQFDEDLTDDYNYRILSRIILCMEEGIILILKDLESIYGSLYDMLNQNYTIIGQKKHCRVAQGPYSNPFCHVADTFRCVVLIDESKLKDADPPFLNRFEKQYLRFFDIVEDQHLLIMKRLEMLIESFTNHEGKKLSKNEIFPIYNNDLVASIILKAETLIRNKKSAGVINEDIETVCKNKLLVILRPDAVIRQKHTEDPVMKELIKNYFALPIHNGLRHFILDQLKCTDKGILSIILTNSNIHAKVPKEIDKEKVQVEKLGNFKSEKQLTAQIKYFWKTNDCNILIIQCCAKNEGKHLLLTKVIVEKCRTEIQNPKHVFLVVHLDKSMNNAGSVSQLNFLSEWTLVMMDNIEIPEVSLPSYYNMTLTEAVTSKRQIKQFIMGELPWAYSRIRFGTFGKGVSNILDTIKQIESSDSILEIIQNRIVSSIQAHASTSRNTNWPAQVANDITALKSASTFTGALDLFVQNTIRAPLAKLVYQLEEKGVLYSFLSNDKTASRVEKRKVWLQLVRDERIFSFDQVPDESGPECYTCCAVNLSLKMPFSMYIYENVETTKDDFMENVQSYRVQCMLDSDKDLSPEVHQEILLRQKNVLMQKFPDLNSFTYNYWKDDYFDDFCRITTQDLLKTHMDQKQAKCLKLILKRLGIQETSNPFVFTLSLHTTYWIYCNSIRSEMKLIDNCMHIFPESETGIIEVLSRYNAEQRRKLPDQEEETQEEDVSIKRDVQDILDAILQKVTQESITDSIRNDLVKTVCERMLPTAACLKQHKGMQNWLDKVNSILPLAAKVSRHSGVIYSLRIVSEFCTHLLLPLNLDQVLLENIGNLIKSGNSLDSTVVYNALRMIIQTSLTRCHSKEIVGISHRLLASYFVWCLAADPESLSVTALLDLFQESKIPPEYTYLYKVPITTFLQTIQELLNADIHKGDRKFFQIEKNTTEEQLIGKLDTVISYLCHNNEYDNPLLVLLTDIIQDIFSNQKTNQNESETQSIIDSQGLFYKCHLLIKQKQQGLRFITATAFCRSFINRAVSLLNCESYEEFYSRILGILDIVLPELPGGCSHGLFLFFQKEMLICRTTSQYDKFCRKFREQCRFLNLIKLKDRASVIPHDKMILCLSVKQDLHADSCFLCCDVEGGSLALKIEELCGRVDDGFGMLQLFSFIIREFYLQRAEFVLDDTRRSYADIILETIVSSSKCAEVQMFVKCLLGKEDFKTKLFMLTERSCQVDANICTLLVSVYSIAFTQGKTCIVGEETFQNLPILLNFLIMPDAMETLYIPGFKSIKPTDVSDDDALGLFKYRKCVDLSKDHSERKCKDCNETFTFIPIMKKFGLKYNQLQGSGLELLTTTDVEYLNPITIHILQFLAKGCILGSIALHYKSEELISKTFSIKDPNETLTQSVVGHWTTMQKLMNMDSNSLAVFLQILLQQAAKHLFVDSLLFQSQNNTLAWENEFDKIVCSLVGCRYEQLKQFYEKHIEYHRFKLQENEGQLLEIGNCMDTKTEDSLTLSLYRVRTQPTKENFCLEMLAHKRTYLLLELVIRSEEDLHLPQHIISIVQWHLAVVANARYVLKRHDCLKMTVEDFIYFKQGNGKKDVMKKRFEAFQKSWEYLKTQPMHIKSNEKMGRIHIESKMSECMILDEDSLPFQVLISLLKIQNSFLESVLQIADKCTTLKFLSNESCRIPCVQVTELKRESLLECTLDWVSMLHQESTCDLKYGHGRRIHYDFLSIEETVAKQVVAGKVFIAIDNLPKIVFMDELHINYAGLVKQLRINVSQKSLTPDVIQVIKGRQNENPRTAYDLITHLGIVMTMMKQIQCKPEQSLVDFVDEWKSEFGRSFPKDLLPNPETCVKLCHVVALSELLEELCADIVIAGLSDLYREKLEGPMKSHLLEQIRKEGFGVVLISAFKRFTYRCLSFQTADPNQSIWKCLSDESFWPSDTYLRNALKIDNTHISIKEILPDGIMVRHVFDCFNVLETELKMVRTVRTVKKTSEI